MPSTLDRPSARHWADLLAILTSVVLIAIAIWPTNASATLDSDRETTVTPALWLAHAAAGALSLLGVTISQRWGRRPLGRAALLFAALILLGALLVFRDLTTRAVLTTLLPALALVIASFAVGPMPRETKP